MLIKIELLGTYRDKSGPNQVALEFDEPPTLQEVVIQGFDYFRNHKKFLDENFINIAVDGKVISSSAWEDTTITSGQRCILFPPIQGG